MRQKTNIYMLRDYRVRVDNLKNDIESENEKFNFNSRFEFLNKIWEIVETKNKTKHGHIKKYDEQLKPFSTYLLIYRRREVDV